MIERWPDPDDIDRYEQSYPSLERNDILRDIVRLVTIAELCQRGFLGQDCVLTGGMALRFRGSNRFTMFDTDSSMRGRLDEVELIGKLGIEWDELTVRPDTGSGWDRSKELTIAKPVEFDAYFASIGIDPITDKFAFTVNMRGLEERAEWVDLRHPYPELVFAEPPSVPVMDLNEQAAEKIVGWAAASLLKHYLDLAWIAREHSGDLKKDDLRRLCRRKLEINATIFPMAYKDLTDLPNLLIPLHKPDDHYGPLNAERDHRKKDIRFMGNQITMDEAKQLVRERIIPLLFDAKEREG